MFYTKKHIYFFVKGDGNLWFWQNYLRGWYCTQKNSRHSLNSSTVNLRVHLQFALMFLSVILTMFRVLTKLNLAILFRIPSTDKKLLKYDQKTTRCDFSKPDISCIASCLRIKIFEYLRKCFSLDIMYVMYLICRYQICIASCFSKNHSWIFLSVIYQKMFHFGTVMYIQYWFNIYCTMFCNDDS